MPEIGGGAFIIRVGGPKNFSALPDLSFKNLHCVYVYIKEWKSVSSLSARVLN